MWYVVCGTWYICGTNFHNKFTQAQLRETNLPTTTYMPEPVYANSFYQYYTGSAAVSSTSSIQTLMMKVTPNLTTTSNYCSYMGTQLDNIYNILLSMTIKGYFNFCTNKLSLCVLVRSINVTNYDVCSCYATPALLLVLLIPWNVISCKG